MTAITPLPGKLVESRQSDRQNWLSILARSAPSDVIDAWSALNLDPSHDVLRPTETGLVMVRGRAGGAGNAFNLGEMTATRTVVRLSTGETGVGYVAGRDRRHALIAALVDALMQTADYADQVRKGVIAPLGARLAAQRSLASRKAAATRVEFFTMVRDRSPRR